MKGCKQQCGKASRCRHRTRDADGFAEDQPKRNASSIRNSSHEDSSSLRRRQRRSGGVGKPWGCTVAAGRPRRRRRRRRRRRHGGMGWQVGCDGVFREMVLRAGGGRPLRLPGTIDCATRDVRVTLTASEAWRCSCRVAQFASRPTQ